MREAGQLIGDLTLLRMLGEGGMAEVWEVDTPNGPRALKILGRRQYSELRKRFRKEVEAMALLRHRNVVRVFGMVEADLPAFLMELLPGGDLRSWLQQPRSTEALLAVFRSVVHGVHHAHSLGVVHRDIKPDNVLMGHRDQPKLADFGLVKVEESQQTGSGATMGSPGYMAPELFKQARHADRRTDIFALGCLLYEMFQGHAPYSANLAKASAFERPMRPRGPEHVRTTIQQCLAMKPEHRPQSCVSLLSLLGGRAQLRRRCVLPDWST